jgi:hypothetical protein
MLPAVGASRPQIMRIVVDLPQPLGPRKPNTSPRRTSRSMPSTAVKSPKRLTNCCTTMAASALMARPSAP